MDGIKTGYIRDSGFNLCASVERDDKRIVAVVMGGKTAASRNQYMASLIEDMFRTASLTKADAIAAYAGDPPGNAAKLNLAGLQPPMPRIKPVIGEAKEVAGIEPVALAGEGSEETGEIDPAPLDAAANVSLAATIASFGEELGKGSEPIKAEVIAAAAAPLAATGQETVMTKSGWTIQIGAFPSQEGAHIRLAEVRDSGIALLSNKPGFTMAAPSGKSMIYRARFSGFTEAHAREACKVLSAKGVDCLPLAP